MQSLPPEVLHLVLRNLDTKYDRQWLWNFARTSRMFYNVSRRVLYKRTAVKLPLINGSLDWKRMETHKEMLARRHHGQAAGDLVHSLVVTFHDPDWSGHPKIEPLEAGLLGFLTILFGLTIRLEKLLLLNVPEHSYALNSNTTFSQLTEISSFQRSIRQKRSLRAVIFESDYGQRSAWWTDVLLSSLPDSLIHLELNLSFTHEPAAEQSLEALSAMSSTLIQKIALSGDLSGAFNRLLPVLLHSSPHAKELVISLDNCSDQILGDILGGAGRKPEILRLYAQDLPYLLQCRRTLQQNIHLKHLDVGYGNAFLYYLPFLPPSMNKLEIWFRLYNPYGPDEDWIGERLTFLPDVILQGVWDAIMPCFKDAAWCPELGELEILFVASNKDAVNKLEREVDQMRLSLAEILGRRKIVPVTGARHFKVEF